MSPIAYALRPRGSLPGASTNSSDAASAPAMRGGRQVGTAAASSSARVRGRETRRTGRRMPRSMPCGAAPRQCAARGFGITDAPASACAACGDRTMFNTEDDRGPPRATETRNSASLAAHCCFLRGSPWSSIVLSVELFFRSTDIHATIEVPGCLHANGVRSNAIALGRSRPALHCCDFRRAGGCAEPKGIGGNPWRRSHSPSRRPHHDVCARHRRRQPGLSRRGEAAKQTEAGGIIAPPTFPQAVAQFDPDYPLRPKPGPEVVRLRQDAERRRGQAVRRRRAACRAALRISPRRCAPATC